MGMNVGKKLLWGVLAEFTNSHSCNQHFFREWFEREFDASIDDGSVITTGDALVQLFSQLKELCGVVLELKHVRLLLITWEANCLENGLTVVLLDEFHTMEPLITVAPIVSASIMKQVRDGSLWPPSPALSNRELTRREE
jgi:hypothetical protein